MEDLGLKAIGKRVQLTEVISKTPLKKDMLGTILNYFPEFPSPYAVQFDLYPREIYGCKVESLEEVPK